MFEHFTFGAPSHTSPHDTIPSTSPTDTAVSTVSLSSTHSPLTPPSYRPIRPSCDLNAIISQFDAQDLSTWSARPPTFDLEDAQAQDEDMLPYFSTAHTMTHPPPVPSTPRDAPRRSRIQCRRLQRQLNARLQTSTAHMRDLNKLACGMGAGGKPCPLYTPTPAPAPATFYLQPSPLVVDTHPYPAHSHANSLSQHRLQPDDNDNDIDIDEGFHEPPSSPSPASTPSPLDPRDPSQFPFSSLRWARSADVAGERGRRQGKVRNKIRMRKRRREIVGCGGGVEV